jgi:hypothetical protein
MTDLLAFIKQRDRTIGIGGLPQGVSHPCSCSIPGPWGGGVIVALVGIAFRAVTIAAIVALSPGNGLLEHFHQELDAVGSPQYLEASNHYSARLFRRHGYRDLRPCEIRLPDGTRFFRMWRAVKA